MTFIVSENEDEDEEDAVEFHYASAGESCGYYSDELG